jgi:hypothetical protein
MRGESPAMLVDKDWDKGGLQSIARESSGIIYTACASPIWICQLPGIQYAF